MNSIYSKSNISYGYSYGINSSMPNPICITETVLLIVTQKEVGNTTLKKYTIYLHYISMVTNSNGLAGQRVSHTHHTF